MALEELINEHRQELNNTDMGIWKYIVQHRAAVRRSSIHELARACNVSTTTIVRFAQKLGLEGFGEFKLLLKREQAPAVEYDTNTLEGLNRFYAQTVDKVCSLNFDRASSLIHEANRIFTYSSGYVQNNVVQELKRLFFYDNILIYDVLAREEFRNLVHSLTKDDLFIIVSFSGESPAVTELGHLLKARDIPFISITRLHDNTLASLSTVNFYISPGQFQLYDKDEERVPFQSMMPYFVLIEVWYVNYCMYCHRLRQGDD